LIIGGFILRRRDFISTSAAAAALRAQTAPRRHVESVVTISRQPEYYHGWPTLAARRNGELLLAYSGGRDAHVCPFGRVELMRSRDSGRTWSWPEVLLDSPIDDRDTGVMETASGSLLVTTFTSLAYEAVLKEAAGWSAEKLERWRAANRRTTPEQRRALQLLASSPYGATDALLLARGFTRRTLAGLVRAELATARHEIVKVGNRGGDHQVDIADGNSIHALFKKIGRFDALVSAAGKVHFGDFAAMTEREMQIGLLNKLMGQVNLVLIGQDHVNNQGSFTLTSGLLSHDPIRYGASASLVNGAVDAFVRAAAIELPRGVRINAVSPGLLTESLGAYGDYFRGHETVPASRVANAYVKSVEGRLTGRVLDVL